ncbi:MAG TPA: Crp/Fnr family transcriptional regulator [Rubrobacter sp.]|nr:Crp/Fnr family transcriptional regulator [Rubrobacter sp.]
MPTREERLVRLLSMVDVLQALSEVELGDLARRCREVPAGNGEDFYRHDEHDGGLFLVLEGSVRGYLTTPAGKEVALTLLGGGTALWARRLQLVDGGAVHARAVGPTELAFLGREDLERLVLDRPEVGLRMMDLLAARLAESNERMAELAHKEVLPRLAGQILRLLEGEGVVDRDEGQRLPTAYTHEELGAMVGANRVAVTRALGRLQDEGMVEVRRRRIHVRDPEALRRLAERES